MKKYVLKPLPTNTEAAHTTTTPMSCPFAASTRPCSKGWCGCAAISTTAPPCPPLPNLRCIHTKKSPISARAMLPWATPASTRCSAPKGWTASPAFHACACGLSSATCKARLPNIWTKPLRSGALVSIMQGCPWHTHSRAAPVSGSSRV